MQLGSEAKSKRTRDSFGAEDSARVVDERYGSPSGWTGVRPYAVAVRVFGEQWAAFLLISSAFALISLSNVGSLISGPFYVFAVYSLALRVLRNDDASGLFLADYGWTSVVGSLIGMYAVFVTAFILMAFAVGLLVMTAISLARHGGVVAGSAEVFREKVVLQVLVWALAMFLVAVPLFYGNAVVVVEREPVLEAITRSFRIATRCVWDLSGFVAVWVLLYWIVALLASTLTGRLTLVRLLVYPFATILGIARLCRYLHDRERVDGRDQTPPNAQPG